MSHAYATKAPQVMAQCLGCGVKIPADSSLSIEEAEGGWTCSDGCSTKIDHERYHRSQQLITELFKPRSPSK
jgi:hypothetical protein